MPNLANPSNYMGYPQQQPMPGYGAPMMGAPMGYPMLAPMPPIMFPISQQAAEEGYYAQMTPPVMPQVQVRGGQPFPPAGPAPVNFTNPQAPQVQPAPLMVPAQENIPVGPIPPMTPQPADDKEIVLSEIDNLLSELSMMKDMASTEVEYGQPRFGTESLKGRSHKELIEDCLNNVINIYPGVTYNLFLNAYNMYDLTIFYNNQRVDYFLVDPYFRYGKGCPVLFGKLAGPNTNGGPQDQMQSTGTTCIPLGCTLAMRQNVFRNVPAEPGHGKNFIGTTTDVYHEICSHMLSQQVYYMLDLSSVDFPDDEAQYLAFGAKIEAINNKYPLKTRYRVYNYVDNDNFILISDNLVKPYAITTDKRKPVNTFIQVSGNTLNITEPNDKKITIEL